MTLGSRASGPRALIGAALVGSVVLAACSGSGATRTLSPTPTPAPSVAPLAVLASGSPVASVPASPPGASMAPGASPSASPDLPDFGNPDRTLPPGMRTWPLSVIDGTIALAAADNEFKLAAADLTTAARTGDVNLMLGALGGLADLAAQALPNAQKLTTWADTQVVGQQLVVAYTAFQASGMAARDALQANDNAAFATAFAGIKAAIADYGTARGGLIDLTELALVMRKGLLVK